MKMQKEKINPMKGWKGALCSMILAISSFSSLNTASANHCEGQCGPRTDTVFPFLSPTLWFHLHLINSDHKYAALFCEIRNQVQFSSVTQSCPTLCNPRNSSTLGLPVHHQLPESTQTNVHGLGDAIQPSHPLSSPSPPAFNLSQHQGLFKWISSSHQVAKVLEFKLQHQSFQWTPRTDLL